MVIIIYGVLLLHSQCDALIAVLLLHSQCDALIEASQRKL